MSRPSHIEREPDQYRAFLETKTGLVLVYKNGKRVDPPPEVISAPAIITFTTIQPMPGKPPGSFVAGAEKTTLLFYRQQWDTRTQKHVENGYTSHGPALSFRIGSDGQLHSKCFPQSHQP
jgi:hypothetical protein